MVKSEQDKKIIQEHNRFKTAMNDIRLPVQRLLVHKPTYGSPIGDLCHDVILLYNRKAQNYINQLSFKQLHVLYLDSFSYIEAKNNIFPHRLPTDNVHHLEYDDIFMRQSLLRDTFIFLQGSRRRYAYIDVLSNTMLLDKQKHAQVHNKG